MLRESTFHPHAHHLQKHKMFVRYVQCCVCACLSCPFLYLNLRLPPTKQVLKMSLSSSRDRNEEKEFRKDIEVRGEENRRVQGGNIAGRQKVAGSEGCAAGRRREVEGGEACGVRQWKQICVQQVRARHGMVRSAGTAEKKMPCLSSRVDGVRCAFACLRERVLPGLAQEEAGKCKAQQMMRGVYGRQGHVCQPYAAAPAAVSLNKQCRRLHMFERKKLSHIRKYRIYASHHTNTARK